ncbi:hypothetical protein NDU88_003387 [Pleurodeles waltl]|uniref:Uncharacterized protein n=1 Tax=Pleurodeles waltl TaxID=8319 RepID=A0AAV7SFI8_PLEWA|nr:hypothetical protein NDU88_003387 [Pleurodeles waltl]
MRSDSPGSRETRAACVRAPFGRHVSGCGEAPRGHRQVRRASPSAHGLEGSAVRPDDISPPCGSLRSNG